MCLFLCQSASSDDCRFVVLKLGSMIPPAVFFFSQDCFAIWGSFVILYKVLVLFVLVLRKMWVHPESIMLSEINQTNTLCYHLYVNLKHQMNMYNKTEAELQREQN